jgi:hypothetical protein
MFSLSYLSATKSGISCNLGGQDKLSICARGGRVDNHVGREVVRGIGLGRWGFAAAFAVARAAEWLRRKDIRSALNRAFDTKVSGVIIAYVLLMVLGSFLLLAHACYRVQRAAAVDRNLLADLHDYSGTSLPGVGV